MPFLRYAPPGRRQRRGRVQAGARHSHPDGRVLPGPGRRPRRLCSAGGAWQDRHRHPGASCGGCIKAYRSLSKRPASADSLARTLAAPCRTTSARGRSTSLSRSRRRPSGRRSTPTTASARPRPRPRSRPFTPSSTSKPSSTPTRPSRTARSTRRSSRSTRQRPASSARSSAASSPRSTSGPSKGALELGPDGGGCISNVSRLRLGRYCHQLSDAEDLLAELGRRAPI
jgi:hypothetical protein